MTDEERNEIEQVLEEAVARPPGEREAFLQEAIADAALREEVASLVRAYERAGGLFEDVASAVVGPALDELQETGTSENEGPKSREEALGSPDPLNLEGKRIGRYAVEAHLGGGGMGLVYKARDPELDRSVALKFLPSHLAAHPEVEDRFVREARAAAALDHPSIATVYEISEIEREVGRARAGQRYIAMAYYDGETLKEKLAREGPLPVKEAVGYATQIAEGLAAAHDAGIVHRDVKPANVIITERETVKLVDFGLARVAGATRLTNPGRRMGTTAYMSPEQAGGEAVDARTDLWALGVVLYEMLAGARPFPAASEPAVLHAVLHDEPKSLREHRSEIPAALEQVTRRCLRKDREERYASAQALAEALRSVRSVENANATVAAPTFARALPGARRPADWPRRWLVGGGAVLAALLFMLGWAVWPDKSVQDSRAPAIAKRSVAVLPFTYLASTDSADYFSLGMTDEVLTRLSQIENLSVIARTSVMQYRGTDKTIPEIGEELGVTRIVEGSVQQAGRQVRIRVQLIDADTGERLWAESFTRPFRDVLQLQSEVARRIAEELKVKLLPRAQRQLAEAPAVDSVAYALYLQGRHLRFRETSESMIRAVRLLRRSVAVDSTFAPAWATLSTSVVIGWNPDRRLPDGLSADSLARAAARRAVELDSTSAEAHVAMGVLRQILDTDFPAAGPWLKRATLFNPGLANAQREYGQYLSRMAQFEEAEPHLKKAARLNPASAHPWYALGWNDLWRGRYGEARHHFEQTLTLQPENWLARTGLVDVHLAQGQAQDALQETRRLVEVNRSPWSLTELGRVYAQTGRPDSARAVLGRMQKAFGPTPFGEAMIYAALGRTDRALDLLEKTGGNHYLKVEPAWKPLRGTPRYEQLLEEMGLDDASVQETMERLNAMDSPGERALP